MCFFLLWRGGSLHFFCCFGVMFGLLKSHERKCGWQVTRCFFFFSVETYLKHHLVVLWLGGEEEEIGWCFFWKTCGRGTPNTYLVSPSSKNHTVSHLCLGNISCLGMGEITKLMEGTLGSCFFDWLLCFVCRFTQGVPWEVLSGVILIIWVITRQVITLPIEVI